MFSAGSGDTGPDLGPTSKAYNFFSIKWQIAKVIHETNIKLEEIYNFQINFHH